MARPHDPEAAGTGREPSDEAKWIEALPQAVLVVCDGQVVLANAQARALFDPAGSGELLGRPATTLEPRPGLLTQPTTYRGRPAELQLLRPHADDAHLQERLERKQQALRALSGRMIHVQERERRHIARELHDEIGQCLSAIRVQFAKLQRRVQAPEALSMIDSAASLTERTLGRVRSLSLLLHPPQLETLGLNAALRWHLEEQQRLHGLRIRFEDAPLPRGLHPDLSIAVYRIVQESLSNALRHGQARRVTVRLQALGDGLRLEVEDDGRGFDPQAVREGSDSPPTLGLAGMAARARLLGGELSVRSSPGGGTCVAAQLPWKGNDEHDDVPGGVGG